jgi:serine/threonine protein kinase
MAYHKESLETVVAKTFGASFGRQGSDEYKILRYLAFHFSSPVMLEARALFVQKNRVTLIMSYHGGSLASMCKEINGSCKHDAILRVALSVLATLNACHQLGIFHNDIHETNIALGSSGPCLIDFGSAWFSGYNMPPSIRTHRD